MPRPDPVLAPPPTRAHVSVARLSRYWYVACTSAELKARPLARTVLGTPLVLFRSADGPGALLDRCPHRNVPLSPGRVVDGGLQCPYHGWRFGGSGACLAVPGLVGEASGKGRDASAYPVRERDGCVWVWMEPEIAPDADPPTMQSPGPGFATVRAEMSFPGSVHAVAENALDVPHTAFLHGGLFRTADKRNTITCRVERSHDRVVARYIGEPRPTGLIGRLLAPGGGEVEHEDSFVLPSLTRVEYRLSEAARVLAFQALTPVTDFETRMYAALHFRIRWMPAWLLRLVVQPVAMKILLQDAAMLRLQTDNVLRFGGERYASTEIDLLGPHIWVLLKSAERFALHEVEPKITETRMRT